MLDTKEIKRFLFEPSKAFKKRRGTKPGVAFRFILPLLVVFSILSGVVSSLFGFSALVLIGGIIGAFVIDLLAILIGAIILHIFAYLFGARKGFNQTLKVVIYSAIPGFVLGWIPFIGIIGGIWGIVLEIIGLTQLQGMSMGRAVLAVLLPIIILLVIVVAAVIYAIGFFGLDALTGLGTTTFYN